MNSGKETLKGSIYAMQTSRSPSFFELVLLTRKRRELHSGGVRASLKYLYLSQLQ